MTTLSRETQQAVQVLTTYLPIHQIMTIDSLTDMNNIFVTNTMFFTKASLATSSLPRENWVWNKSRPNTEVELDDGIAVSLYKLNARKINESDSFFSTIKVWIFLVKLSPTETINFFWCETGYPEIVPVVLEDLAFLNEYVSPITAKSFGWL